jgi:uncharacterized repeat protein (TIGR01451 family)
MGNRSNRNFLGRRALSTAVTLALAATLGLVTLLVGSSSGAPPTPVGSADLSVTKTASPNPVTTGGALTYSIQVTNSGPDAATNAIVTDKLPNGVNFVSAVSTQGSCSTKGKGNGNTVSCALGTLASNVGTAADLNPVTITIHVLAPKKAGTISNTASVGSDLSDPQSANDSATATTQVIKGTGPTCSGHRATILGTPGADVLAGSAGNDVIVARAGSDRIVSFGGSDLICAGAGGDLVKAGAGHDVLRGGRGPDRLRGGRGPDLLVGGRGNDRCSGGPGRDTLRSC